MVKQYAATTDVKDKVFNKLMKEHMGEEKAIDLRHVAAHIQLHAWLEYEVKFTDEEVKRRILTFLEFL